jgi:Flp pilus assembly pilin Flp
VINVYLEYLRAQLSKVGINPQSERGANAVEYILIASLIALAIFATFKILGEEISSLATEITNKL